MSSVTLFAPGLFADLFEQANGVVDPARWPALAILCARAAARRIESNDAASSLIALFGTATGESELRTIADLSALIDHPDLGGDGLMRADPVHLRVEPNQILLFSDPDLTPSPAEADALLESLNRGFDDLRFVRGRHPGRWYFQYPQRPLTHSPYAANGRSIARYLPHGAGADRLTQIMNDAQMLLHEHAVNRAREARRQPLINAVWPWGATVLAEAEGEPPDLVIGDDVTAAALATANAFEWRAHAVAEEVVAEVCRHRRRALVVLGSPTGGIEGQGSAPDIDAVEQHWAAPILAALRRFGLKRAILVTDREMFTVEFWNLFKTWRKPLRIVDSAP